MYVCTFICFYICIYIDVNIYRERARTLDPRSFAHGSFDMDSVRLLTIMSFFVVRFGTMIFLNKRFNISAMKIPVFEAACHCIDLRRSYVNTFFPEKGQDLACTLLSSDHAAV